MAPRPTPSRKDAPPEIRTYAAVTAVSSYVIGDQQQGEQRNRSADAMNYEKLTSIIRGVRIEGPKFEDGNVLNQIKQFIKPLVDATGYEATQRNVVADQLDLVKENLIKMGIPEEDVHTAFFESGADQIRDILDFDRLPPCPGGINQNSSAEKNDNAGNEERSDDTIQLNKSIHQLKSRMPCKSCRMTCCSNCLVPFQNGDKMIKRIPSREVGSDHQHAVPLEAALICVFDKANPYPKWIKEMERAASESIPISLMKLFEEAPQFNNDTKTEDGEGKDTEEPPQEISAEQRKKDIDQCMTAVFEEVETELQTLEDDSTHTYWDLVKEKIDEMKKNRKDGPTCAEMKAFLLEKFEESRAENEKEVKLELTAKKITEYMSESTSCQGLHDFQMCVGCAELLTVLFMAWENLQSKKLTRESYYYAVMLGFKNAKFAQDVIFRAPESSKMHIFNKYSKECHPIGCQQRSTRHRSKYNFGHGATCSKFTLGSNKGDLIKNAVGNLHAYLEESYRRVYQELIRLMDCSSDSSSEEDSEEDLDGEDEEVDDRLDLKLTEITEELEDILSDQKE